MHRNLLRAITEFFEQFTGRSTGWDEDLRLALNVSRDLWRHLSQLINLLATVRSLGLKILPEQMDHVSTIRQIIELLEKTDASPKISKPRKQSWQRQIQEGRDLPASDDDLERSANYDAPFIASERRELSRDYQESRIEHQTSKTVIVAHGEVADDRQTEIRIINHGEDEEWDYNRPIYLDKTWAIDIAIKPPSEAGGVPAPGGRQSINKPAFSRSIELLVKVTDASTGAVQMRIEDSFRTLALPPQGASRTRRIPFTPALRKPEEAGGSATWEGKLNVQIFYRLNLIDAIEINLKVIAFTPAVDSEAPSASDTPVHFIQYQQQQIIEARSLGWLGDDVEPRAMVAYIASEDKKLSLDFTIVRTGATPIRLSAVSFASHYELGQRFLDLTHVRRPF
jgi:hypothetical protein